MEPARCTRCNEVMMEARPGRKRGVCVRCLGMTTPGPGRCMVCGDRTHDDPEVAQRKLRCAACERAELV